MQEKKKHLMLWTLNIPLKTGSIRKWIPLMILWITSSNGKSKTFDANQSVR